LIHLILQLTIYLFPAMYFYPIDNVTYELLYQLNQFPVTQVVNKYIELKKIKFCQKATSCFTFEKN